MDVSGFRPATKGPKREYPVMDQDSSNIGEQVDVLIAGAGLAGLTAALALKQLHGGTLKVALADARLGQTFKPSGRAYALAGGVCRMYDALGVWSELAMHSQPITRMVITDSRLSEPVRPIFLTFESEEDQSDQSGGAYATMVEQDRLWQVLERKVREAGVSLLTCDVTGHASQGHQVRVDLGDGSSCDTRLLVACDGAESPIRKRAGIAMIVQNYGQSGIVATVEHERDHQGVAQEHFLPSGPFATLPLTDNRSSIVWTEPTGRAKTYLAMSRAEQVEEIEKRFGLKLGRLTLLDRPQAFPLRIGMARRFVGPRLALVGDAAHLVHPIAGQGLNLGLRDVAALADVIDEAVGLGLDIGAGTVLDNYEQARRFDTVVMAGLTDTLNRLFSNDVTPLRLLRTLGLGLVDRMPRLKTRLIREAAAINTRMPRLLRGEALHPRD